MFPTGSVGGWDGPAPPSPGGDLQKDQAVEESLHRKPQKSLHCPPAVDTKPDAEDGVGDGGEETAEDDDEGSGIVVEHILKELKGINKIQEEISDLRRYLTSVRGSVDRVSSCVDTVLSEIGELYSGASAAPPPAAGPQTGTARRGSLGRQNATTSSPPDGSAGGGRVCRVRLLRDQQTGRQDHQQDAGAAGVDLCYMELHRRHDYRSSSSLSSCLGPGAALASEGSDLWASVGLQTSPGWDEEDACCPLRTLPGLWDRLGVDELDTPGPSSYSSLEHLSPLFGCLYNPPSSWGHQRAESKGSKAACYCPRGCPYWSSGSPSVDLCLAEAGGPSRSVSSSTVQLTDADDGYLEPSSGDTVHLGSTDSLDRDWTDCSVSRGEAGDAVSRVSSLLDLQTPSTSSDVRTFSRTVLTFRSALMEALRTLEGPNPEDAEEAPEEKEARQADSTAPEDHCGALVPTELLENRSSSSQTSPLRSPREPAGCPAPVGPSKSAAPERWTEGQPEGPLGPGFRAEEARLSPIREIQEGEELSHRERIARFQRLLREKRRAGRLSRSVPSSQGSHGSQGSQGSQEEVLPGTFRLFLGWTKAMKLL